MIVVHFTRYFTSGLGEGLTHNDSLSFPDAEAKDRWLRRINPRGHDKPRWAFGLSEYIITDIRVKEG